MRNLDKFVSQLTIKFDAQRLLERRTSTAQMIAAKYSINPPSVILLFTLPDYQELTLSERCEKSGITEEELFLCVTQDGFKKFLYDFKEMLKDTLDLQSLRKLCDTVALDRTIIGKDGSDRMDVSVEMRVLDKPQVNTVNVQNNTNTFYDQARQRALELHDTDIATDTA